MRISLGRRTLTLASAAIAIALLVPGAAGANVFSDLDEPATIESGPTISIATDKADYAPGELVTVTGSGWQPGESVAISVVDDGVAEERFQYDSVVTADENGDIVERFNIAEWYVAEYYVTATGEFSGAATTTFTDTLADYRQGTTGVGGTPACTDPQFAVASDDQRARCVRTTGATGQSVIVSGFGLDTVVPVGATNIQFNVEVEGLRGTANRAVRIALSHDGGTTFTTATNDTTQFTSGTSDQIKTFPTTQPTNCDNFGRTWTRSATPALDELSDAKFQVRATTLGAASATDFVDIDRIRVRACWDGSNIIQAATGGRLTGVSSPSPTNLVGQVQVNLRGSGAPAWKGTTYQFGAGSEVCVDTGNHTGSAGGVTADHFFEMTPPAAHGTYDLTFRAYPNDDCSGTPLTPFTLTNAVTVGIFGDSFGRETDGVYTENTWTDGGADCTVERMAGIIDFDGYLQVRQGCTQTRSNIDTSGLENIHLKYRWGQDTNAAVTNGLEVEWRVSGGSWEDVGTGAHNLTNSGGVSTIPNSEDFDLGDDAEDTSIDIRFRGNTNADALKALVDDVLVTGDPIPESATVTVHKDFSDDNDDAVSVDLTDCSSGTDSPTGAQSATDEDNLGGAPAEFTVSNLSAGTTCTVVENPVPSGYTATYGGDCDEDGVVTIDPGDDADCTVTNTLNTATFTVTKTYSDSNTDAVDVQLDCSDDSFDDTGSASPGTGNEEVFDLSGFEDEAMTCSVTETRPSGYTDSYSAGCTSVTIEVDGDYTCDITNTLNSATFTVTKTYSDSNTDAVDVQLDCSDDSFDDTGSASPGTGNEEVFNLAGFEDTAMTCTVTETRPDGYTASYDGDCDDVTVEVDGDYTCDITNTLNTATFTVTKTYSDSNTDAVDVQLDCTGDDFDDTGSASPGTGNEEVFNLAGFEDEAITCDVTETKPNGYTASYSTGCSDVTIEVDGEYQCDITNTLNTATFTVTKTYSDSNTDAVDVQLDCSDDAYDDTGSASPGTGNEAVFNLSGFEDSAMTCSVTETPPDGYTASYDGDCEDVTVEVDGDYTCDITNTLNTATFTVTKAYSDSNTDAVDVQLDCSDDDFDDTGSASPGTGNEAVFNLSGFNDGAMTCTVTETRPSGYKATYSGDCKDVTVEVDGDYTCDITNTLNTATFTVYKEYSPAGPTASSTMKLDCTGTAHDDSKQAAPGAGNEATFNLSGFEDGVPSCSITEDPVPSGYTDSYGSGCTDVTIADDGSYSCTVTNTLNEADITVSKQYTDSNTNAVSVKLECEGGTIGGSNPRNVAPGSPQTFHVTGFDTGDTCDASENPVPAGYAQDNTDCQDVTLGTKTACTIKNVTALTLVTQGGCTFDRDTSRQYRQFPLIYTPDGSASGHKLNASNPGQFFMNAAYGGSASSIRIWIPYPFVTVGTNPVKVYDGVQTTNASKTCFAPENLVRSQTNQINWTWSGTGANTFGNKQYIDVTVPPGGFVYVRIHLAYGLKGVAGSCAKGADAPPTATCTSPAVTISGYKMYEFSFGDGAISSTDKIESYNVFKKNPGIGGLVLQNGTTAPIGNTKVEVWQSNKKMADLSTDEDGWYMWTYKYTGKAATFNVKLPSYGLQQSVTLKSNGYLSVPFTTP